MFPANIYLFKVNSRNTKKRCEICSKLTIKIPEQRQMLKCCIINNRNERRYRQWKEKRQHKGNVSSTKAQKIRHYLTFRYGEEVKWHVNITRHSLKMKHIFGEIDFFQYFFILHTVQKYNNPAGIYLPKTSNGNTKNLCEIYSKLTTMTPDRPYWLRSGTWIVEFA